MNEEQFDDEMADEPIGDWLMEWDYDMQVKEGIACPERNYPQSEARFDSIEDWEQHHDRKWYSWLAEIF